VQNIFMCIGYAPMSLMASAILFSKQWISCRMKEEAGSCLCPRGVSYYSLYSFFIIVIDF
jgi:hypothetical protein